MTDRRLRIAIAAVAALGVLVASYLVYVKYAEVEPFCVTGGSSCQKVQSSDQSELFGIPVALLGLAGYIAILASLLLRGDPGRVLGALLAIGGAAFSWYLTYVSIAVIEAACQWCITSMVLMTILAVLTSRRLLREPD